MITATVIEPFPGRPDGEARAVKFAPGDTVSGDLAEVAIAQGWATRSKKGAPENKALGGAPEDKFRDSANVGGSDGGNSGERAEPNAGTNRRSKRK